MRKYVQYTARFRRDLKRAERQKKDLSEVYEVIDILAEGEKLDERYRDHALIGEYTGARECHIERDWLLVYTIYEDDNVLFLDRLGTHSELFG